MWTKELRIQTVSPVSDDVDRQNPDSDHVDKKTQIQTVWTEELRIQTVCPVSDHVDRHNPDSDHVD